MANTERIINHDDARGIVEKLGGIAQASIRHTVAIPTLVSSTLVYTGDPVSLEWTNLDTSKVIVMNGTATEVGSYEAKLYLKNPNDLWDDNTTDPKIYNWIIKPSLVSISWSSGTDAEIVKVVEALDNGEISPDDLAWAVGDQRIVHLKKDESGYLSLDEQDVTLVILDKDHYDLVDGGKCHYVIGFKDDLNEVQAYHYNDTNVNGYKGSRMRYVVDEIFDWMIPDSIKPIFKKFNIVTAEKGNSDSVSLTTITDSYFALFAEQEILGERTYSPKSEADVLSQIEYYKVKKNRVKYLKGVKANWWTRSPVASNSTSFCDIGTGGGAHTNPATADRGVSPFGVI